jgi:hypothetical protein
MEAARGIAATCAVERTATATARDFPAQGCAGGSLSIRERFIRRRNQLSAVSTHEGRLKKGEFLAHRNVHRSEDETANSIVEGTG